jgi:hypothetical protein
MGQISVFRPDVPDSPASSLQLAERAAPPARPTVGLIANGKPLASELLELLAAELGTRLGSDVDTTLLEKPHAGVTISSVQADGMAARAHFVLTGVGD